jgi:hypothetical protein
MASDSPNAESVLNVVAYLMDTLALVVSAAVVFWMWSNGDLVWPFGHQSATVPARIPGLDHCSPSN